MLLEIDQIKILRSQLYFETKMFNFYKVVKCSMYCRGNKNIPPPPATHTDTNSAGNHRIKTVTGTN